MAADATTTEVICMEYAPLIIMPQLLRPCSADRNVVGCRTDRLGRRQNTQMFIENAIMIYQYENELVIRGAVHVLKLTENTR